MILASIKFIYSSKHFDGQLMWLKYLQTLCAFQYLLHYTNESGTVMAVLTLKLFMQLTAFTAFETETLVDAHKIYKSVHRVTIIAH